MRFRSMLPIILCGALHAAPFAAASDRETTMAREAFACTSWAGWREYVQASLTPRGARPDARCPIRIPVGAKVIVVDEDAGQGAAEVRYRGKTWFVDEQRLR
jgi:hypothetical protein